MSSPRIVSRYAEKSQTTIPNDDLSNRSWLQPAGVGASSRKRPGRTITVLAVGLLALDGALLLMAGVWLRRIGLVAWGLLFVLGAVAVSFYWRHYLRRLREINEGLESRFLELMELTGDVPGPEGKEE